MRRSRVLFVVRLVVVAVAIALLARAARDVDWAGTCRIVCAAGPSAVVAIAPFAVALLLDSCAFVLIARGGGLDLRARVVLGVRVISEALHFGAPGGVVASEAAAVALLGRRCAITTQEATALVARRKQLVMRTHTIYLALGAWLGASALAAIGASLHLRGIPHLVLASAAVPLATSIALGLAMRRAPTEALRRARQLFVRLAKAREETALSMLLFLAAWLVECVDTAIILRLAGTPLSMTSVLAIETALSLARSAVAFVPGGLGVQDLGYGAMLAALGVPADHAAAFVLLKRAKEIVWIAIGFAVAGARVPRAKGATTPVT